MTALRNAIGAPVDRVDGSHKVTGTATYPSDVSIPNMAHAALVESRIAAGTIRRIETARAKASPGVLGILTHENAPKLAAGPASGLGPTPPLPLRSDRIVAYGQHVAIVVAETREQAVAAARLVEVDYAATPPIVGIEHPRAAARSNPWGLDAERGDVAAGIATADVVVDARYAIAPETNNPLGLFATVAQWHGDRLVVHDSTQWPVLVQQTLAAVFDVPESSVRVLVPYLGGGFGAGLRVWPHIVLAVLAARVVQRPVKLVLTRPQMFTSVGHRAETVQRVRVGASSDGHLVAMDHEATSALALEDENFDPVTAATGASYACPNVATHDRQVRLHIPSPGYMRGPGTAEGNFAIESAMDELAHELRIDPLDLRLRNYAEVHPPSGRPWSSKALRECLRIGADRFGWSKRNPSVGSMRDGHWRVGYGMAAVTFERYQAPCTARVSLRRDGTACVRASATDIGTGTYTIAAQIAAALLGLEIANVRVEIGDTTLPVAPQSGGSGLATAFGSAIHDAVRQLHQALLERVANDGDSPLQGKTLDEVAAAQGRIHVRGDGAAGEKYVDILARHALDELSADGESAPPAEGEGIAPAGPFGAQFVELRVDEDLGLVRVARVVSVIDAGRILNEKTARSQIMGGVVMGVGMALLEATVFDPSTGRVVNGTFGDYLVPVNADIPSIDVTFTGAPDTASPIGAKGVGEVGTIGIAAAIANAVFHATGRRLRSLPITLDQLL